MFHYFTLNGFSGPFSEREDFLLVFCLGIYVMGPDTCIFSDFLFIVINNQEIKYVVNIGIFRKIGRTLDILGQSQPGNCSIVS